MSGRNKACRTRSLTLTGPGFRGSWFNLRLLIETGGRAHSNPVRRNYSMAFMKRAVIAGGSSAIRPASSTNSFTLTSNMLARRSSTYL